jgi:hypothetical protein
MVSAAPFLFYLKASFISYQIATLAGDDRRPALFGNRRAASEKNELGL